MARQDLVIIGGGAGGLVVASVASQLGLKTTLVEAEPVLGGDCLHYGCVPSKALIHAAGVAAQIRRASDYGLEATLAPVDLQAVLGRVREAIGTLQVHDDPERFRGYGCDVVFGHARFTGPDTIEVGGQRITGRRFVLATGSSAFIPPIPGLAEAGFLTNREIFALPALPPRLAVVGGGPIGIELAQAFARLGSKVTVIQRGGGILPREDAEAAALLQGRLAREGVEFCFDAELERVERTTEGLRRLYCRTPQGEQVVEAEEVLIAVGRQPNVQGLGLEQAGVVADRRGVQVDARLRTSNRRIYACGDICGPYQFTHMAEYQAGIVLANAVFHLPRKVDYRVVPWVTYCAPELARVGLTEAEAKQQGIEVDVLRFDFADVDRAVVEHETDGFVKLVVRRGSRWRGGGTLLGATVLGQHGGELLHELVLAMHQRLRIDAIAGTIHAYPTRAQVHRRAVNRHLGRHLFSPAGRAAAKIMSRIFG